MERRTASTPIDAKCRVLLIDDCPDTVHLIRAYLADPGIVLTVASEAGYTTVSCATVLTSDWWRGRFFHLRSGAHPALDPRE